MTILGLILVLTVIAVAMILIRQYVPTPVSYILLVVCGIALVIIVLQVAGLNLGAVRVGG